MIEADSPRPWLYPRPGVVHAVYSMLGRMRLLALGALCSVCVATCSSVAPARHELASRQEDRSSDQESAVPNPSGIDFERQVSDRESTMPLESGTDTDALPELAKRESAVRAPGGSEALQLLAARRLANKDADFPIGPGDVLQITVPGMDQLKDVSVRVSNNRTISLPLLGEIRVDGLTEEEARHAVEGRLGRYMHTPQVDLFVKEYRSRQVAVAGAVDKPGLYTLDRRSETLLDMISQAGGVKDDAAQRVLLIPAERAGDQRGAVKDISLRSSDNDYVGRISPPSQDRLVQTVMVPEHQLGRLISSQDPIVIDLANLGHETTSLQIPAEPGDVIFVPHAGEVLVQGWVGKPGDYKITPGLGVLGAVAAAGGPLFAADQTSVKLVRSGPDGTKVFMTADLEKIENGQAPDIPLQEGDVIDAPYSAIKVMPYSVFSILSRFYVGANAPLF